MGNPTNEVDALMTLLFKYKGTNCSRVAEQIGVSRQVLFRMIKNGTMKMPVFLKVLDVLDIKMDFVDSGSLDQILKLKDYDGPQIRKKIRGAVYDTKKMLSVEEKRQEGIVEVLCYEPVQRAYLIIQYEDREDGRWSMRLVDEEEKAKFLGTPAQ